MVYNQLSYYSERAPFESFPGNRDNDNPTSGYKRQYNQIGDEEQAKVRQADPSAFRTAKQQLVKV